MSAARPPDNEVREAWAPTPTPRQPRRSLFGAQSCRVGVWLIGGSLVLGAGNVIVWTAPREPAIVLAVVIAGLAAVGLASGTCVFVVGCIAWLREDSREP